MQALDSEESYEGCRELSSEIASQDLKHSFSKSFCGRGYQVEGHFYGTSQIRTFQKGKLRHFQLNPPAHEKTIFIGLAGRMGVCAARFGCEFRPGLRGAIALLFHIDEAMSWESVRNLRLMPPLLLIIRNLCLQGKAPDEVIQNIDDVNEVLTEALEELHR